MPILRKMERDDIESVVAVIESQDDDDAEEAEAAYRNLGGVLDQLVLEVNGKIIGVTGFSKQPGCDQTYYLSWTYVDAEFANRGHGRKMMTELIDGLKQLGGRKLFVKVSDYESEEDGAIYAAALHLYQSLGFEIEITHSDYYDEDEAMIILGLRLSEQVSASSAESEKCVVYFNKVFEIGDTDGAYTFAWHDEGKGVFTQQDVEIGLDAARSDSARAVFLSFPSTYTAVEAPLLAAGFIKSGQLLDYYEEGVHEQHYTFNLTGSNEPLLRLTNN